MPEDVKEMLHDLCANHTRCLPIDEANRKFEKHMDEVLGAEFAEAKVKTGLRARLETSGVALLRSLCKLLYHGQGAYEKGDGETFRIWLQDNYPSLAGKPVGRHELSKRQDWVLEVCRRLLPLLGPALHYLVGTLVLPPNV